MSPPQQTPQGHPHHSGALVSAAPTGGRVVGLILLSFCCELGRNLRPHKHSKRIGSHHGVGFDTSADEVGKTSFLRWNGGNLLRTAMLPASRTRHRSYNMDFWKSQQSAVLIFQGGSTIQANDMQEHCALVRKDAIPDLVVVFKGQRQTRPTGHVLGQPNCTQTSC